MANWASTTWWRTKANNSIKRWSENIWFKLKSHLFVADSQSGFSWSLLVNYWRLVSLRVTVGRLLMFYRMCTLLNVALRENSSKDWAEITKHANMLIYGSGNEINRMHVFLWLPVRTRHLTAAFGFHLLSSIYHTKTGFTRAVIRHRPGSDQLMTSSCIISNQRW